MRTRGASRQRRLPCAWSPRPTASRRITRRPHPRRCPWHA
uniref:Uncharacterized protein n=1 Tax=Setaria italica TaxID=4555 RepID=K3XU96_SETIT